MDGNASGETNVVSGLSMSERQRALLIPARVTAESFDRMWSVANTEYTGTHCVVSFAGRVDDDRLVRAVRLTLDAEPILGCRFVERWFRPYWRRGVDLDHPGVCAVRESSDREADLRAFVTSPPDLALRVVLLRGESDVLCVKLDHRAGDGTATKEYAYLLADVYNHLGDDPRFVPVPNVEGSRSMRQVGNVFSIREKLRVVRQSPVKSKQRNTLGQWTFARPQDEPWEFELLVTRLDAARVRSIFEYARYRRTTVAVVLLAAFYLAAYRARPQPSPQPLPLAVPVDLRRYLPAKKAAAPCNLVGMFTVTVDSQSGKSLDDVVEQIRVQMQGPRKEYLGLARSTFFVDTLPVIRHLPGLVPYGWIKRVARRTAHGRLASGEDVVMTNVLVTDLGKLEPDRLAFAGAEVTDAYATIGVFKKQSRILGMAVSRFRGALTLTVGCGSRTLITRLSEHMLRILPA